MLVLVLVLLDLVDVGERVGVGVDARRMVDGVVVVGALVATWFPPTLVGATMVMEMPLTEQSCVLRSNISERIIRLCVNIEARDLTLLI